MVSSLKNCYPIVAVAVRWLSLCVSSITLEIVIFYTYVCMSVHPLCAGWKLEYDVMLLMSFVLSLNLPTEGVGWGGLISCKKASKIATFCMLFVFSNKVFICLLG